MTRTRARIVTEGYTTNVIAGAAKPANTRAKGVLGRRVADGPAVAVGLTKASGEVTRMFLVSGPNDTGVQPIRLLWREGGHRLGDDARRLRPGRTRPSGRRPPCRSGVNWTIGSRPTRSHIGRTCPDARPGEADDPDTGHNRQTDEVSRTTASP